MSRLSLAAKVLLAAALCTPLVLAGCDTEVEQGVVPPDEAEFSIEQGEGRSN